MVEESSPSRAAVSTGQEAVGRARREIPAGRRRPRGPPFAPAATALPYEGDWEAPESRPAVAMIAVSFSLKGDLPGLAGPAGLADYVLGLAAPSSVKDALESLGIPHTEVDLLLLGGLPVGFGHRLRDGDRLEVFPPPRPADDRDGLVQWPEGRLQPRPLACDRFVCDRHLGRLARLLRLLGFDTAYRRDWTEPQIARAAARDDRVVLTRSRALLRRKAVARGCLVRSERVDEQARELARRFDLAARLRPFARCTLCNGELRPVPKAAVAERIPLRTRAWRHEYFLCRSCDHLYWEGTHVERMRERIGALLAEPEAE